MIKASLQAKYVYILAWVLKITNVEILLLLNFRENRYLLFLTENYSALRILQQTDLIDHDPLVLFGSSFPQDINYTQVTIFLNQAH